MIAPEEQVKTTFNRLRAQLLSIVETLSLDKKQEEAIKRMVKDRTSEAWNDITGVINNLQNK